MRYAASLSQFLQVSSVPLGARTVLGPDIIHLLNVTLRKRQRSRRLQFSEILTRTPWRCPPEQVCARPSHPGGLSAQMGCKCRYTSDDMVEIKKSLPLIIRREE